MSSAGYDSRGPPERGGGSGPAGRRHAARFTRRAGGEARSVPLLPREHRGARHRGRAGGANKADRGCIVVCQDGEMYEFSMKIQAPNDFDFGMERDDSVKPVQLPPEDYVAYAYHAIQEIAGLLAEQRARAKKYSF